MTTTRKVILSSIIAVIAALTIVSINIPNPESTLIELTQPNQNLTSPRPNEQSVEEAADYKIISGHLPPWSFKDGHGIHADIVSEIQKRIGSNKPIEYFPWSRAQYIALRNDNYIIFPITRNKNREDLYKWHIPVMPAQVSFVSFGGEPVDIKQAKTLKVVLCAQDTPPHMWLKKNGFTNIRTLTRAPLVALRMLQNGRGDAWLANTTVAEYSSLFDENIRGKLVYGPPVLKSTSYIAFTKNFPTNIIEKYKKAYAEIKSDGTYDEIMEKYMKRSVETLNNR